MGTIISEDNIAKDFERISSSNVVSKLCDGNYSKDNIAYNTDTDTNKLKNQLVKLLEKIANTNEAHHFAELHNLISIIETKLDKDELLLILGVVGSDTISYDIHKSTTSMELELHLRTYILVLEAYNKRQPVIRKQLCQTLYKSLAALYDTHKRHTELLKRGLINAKSLQGQHKVKPVKYGPYSILEKAIEREFRRNK
ncbi:1107_t:CDS:2 [Paraglomus occultum]|uniref:1107_t:CDS:1 n=1 Tax=Paraglomus occultum TaxID=144539 RepID=A0A9N9GEX5_9GLOM|nr:1107_t:CDS:2 [Paraglomus occultum]